MKQSAIPLNQIHLRDFSVLPYAESRYHIPYRSRDLIPTKEGVYILVSAEQSVLYIGSSQCLRQRLVIHPKISEFKEVPSFLYYLITDRDSLYFGRTQSIERYFIEKLTPLYNILFNKKRFKRNRDGSYTNIVNKTIRKIDRFGRVVEIPIVDTK